MQKLENNYAKAEYKLTPQRQRLDCTRGLNPKMPEKSLQEGWQEYYDGRNELAQKTEEAQAEIDDAKQQLQEALVDLNSGEEDYKTGLAEYNDGLAEYNDGKAELDDAKAELDSARRKLNSTKKELQQAESSYNSLSALNSAAVGIAAQTGFSDGSELIYAIENGLLDDKTKAMIDQGWLDTE